MLDPNDQFFPVHRHADRYYAPYRSGPSETWIKVKKSESAGGNASTRWNVLIVSSDTESCVDPQTHTDCKID
jgi:hypothetical protein